MVSSNNLLVLSCICVKISCISAIWVLLSVEGIILTDLAGGLWVHVFSFVHLGGHPFTIAKDVTVYSLEHFISHVFTTHGTNSWSGNVLSRLAKPGTLFIVWYLSKPKIWVASSWSSKAASNTWQRHCRSPEILRLPDWTVHSFRFTTCAPMVSATFPLVYLLCRISWCLDFAVNQFVKAKPWHP